MENQSIIAMPLWCGSAAHSSQRHGAYFVKTELKMSFTSSVLFGDKVGRLSCGFVVRFGVTTKFTQTQSSLITVCSEDSAFGLASVLFPVLKAKCLILFLWTRADPIHIVCCYQLHDLKCDDYEAQVFLGTDRGLALHQHQVKSVAMAKKIPIFFFSD